MSRKVPPRNHPCQLRVEGRDDLFAVATLLERHGLDYSKTPWSPYIAESDGVEGLLEVMSVDVKGSTPRLGFVLDADASVGARWTQIRERCGAAGVELEEFPAASGTVVRVGSRRLGFWLMPNNSSSGAIEDFLERLVPSTDTIWPLAKDCTSSAIEAGAPLGPGQAAKGRLHTWLAWQKRPGMPFGTALTAKVLDSDAADAMRFLDWVRALFGPEEPT